MFDFKHIYEHALNKKGGEAAVKALLPSCKSAKALSKIPDDRYLSQISLRVFRAGLKHSLVDARWDAFEESFFGFDPAKVVLISDEQMEARMQDKRLIRHWGKMKSVRINAQMVQDLSEEHGGFGKFLAAWPITDITGLWQLLAKQGYQLGGTSAPYFLRMVGKDTFMFSTDVVASLKLQKIVDKKPTSKRDLAAVQAAFNQWHEESGRPMCEISRLLAFTVD